jgi:hypothetical protein
MKYYTFYRENNNFKDILSDANIKKSFDEITLWHRHLTIGIKDSQKNTQIGSYITLKYGDEMKSDVIKDFSPVPGVDYTPNRDAYKSIKKIK